MSSWQLSSYLGPLGTLPTAPRLARGFAVVVLTGWGLTDSADSAELIASELATNVVEAATDSSGRPRYDESGRLYLMWLRLLSDRKRMLIEIWDNLPEQLGTPVTKHARPSDESGRGLDIVATLSEDWGWEAIPGWTGKRVWAILGPQP